MKSSCKALSEFVDWSGLLAGWLAVRGLLIIIFNFLFYTRMVIFFWDLFFLEHGPNHLQIITKLGVAWWLLSAKLDRAAEQEAETSQTDQRSWRGGGIYTERE